jgi:hypothetical protein
LIELGVERRNAEWEFMVIAWESIVGKLPQLKLKYAQEI